MTAFLVESAKELQKKKLQFIVSRTLGCAQPPFFASWRVSQMSRALRGRHEKHYVRWADIYVDLYLFRQNRKEVYVKVTSWGIIA